MNRKRHRYCHRQVLHSCRLRARSGAPFTGASRLDIRGSISRIHLPARRYSRSTNSTRIISSFACPPRTGQFSRQSVRDAAQKATCNKRKRFNTNCVHKTHWPCASDWLTTMSGCVYTHTERPPIMCMCNFCGIFAIALKHKAFIRVYRTNVGERAQITGYYILGIKSGHNRNCIDVGHKVALRGAGDS